MPKNAVKLPVFALLRGKKHAVQLRGLHDWFVFGMIQADVHQKPLPRGGARFALNPFHFKEVVCMFAKLYVRLQSARAELDEKALLIALFVIAAIVGLSPLGQAIAAKFQQLASTLGS